jgi:hypothetical protein
MLCNHFFGILRAVITVGSTPTVLLPSDCSAVLDNIRHVERYFKDDFKIHHSCQVGTSSMPCFRRCQLLSSCLDAWLKYRPSVARAAFSKVMTAVPAEPENPEMYSGRVSVVVCMHRQDSDLGVHHRERCTQIGGCLRMEQLEIIKKRFISKVSYCSYYIHLPYALS